MNCESREVSYNSSSEYISELKLPDFNAGIFFAEMVGRSNFIALVGGGKQPKFPQNKVGKRKTVNMMSCASVLIKIVIGYHMG